jgi:hypothetical protein
MINIPTITSTCEAEGHPSSCNPVVTGEVQSTENSSISVNNIGGVEKEIATVNTADIHFNSHSHDYSVEQGCHQNQSHDIDPTEKASSLTLSTLSSGSSNLYIVGDGVGQDPISGGNVNITDAGENKSIKVK